MLSADKPIRYDRYSLSSGWETEDAHVITEAAVDLTVNGLHWLSFSCTPTNLDALAVGFLFNEGVIQKREEVVNIDVCRQGCSVDVWLSHAVERPTQWRRTSGCTGGMTTVENGDLPRPIPLGEPIRPEELLSCMEQLLQAQELYREAGGVHTSAVSDGQTIRMRAEDIGRHNTIDKLAGRMLLEGIHPQPAIVITTGRISSEMLQKSARLGAVAVVSRTSPTSQSVELAERMGITLVGYARRNGFIVYAHAERVLQDG